MELACRGYLRAWRHHMLTGFHVVLRFRGSISFGRTVRRSYAYSNRTKFKEIGENCKRLTIQNEMPFRGRWRRDFALERNQSIRGLRRRWRKWDNRSGWHGRVQTDRRRGLCSSHWLSRRMLGERAGEFLRRCIHLKIRNIEVKN